MIPIRVVRGEIEGEMLGYYNAEDAEDALNALEIIMEYENVGRDKSKWIEIGRDKEW